MGLGGVKSNQARRQGSECSACKGIMMGYGWEQEYSSSWKGILPAPGLGAFCAIVHVRRSCSYLRTESPEWK